ncbi:hypothetical protein M153_15900013759 [Pseudoloma neurophilia]|uniref:Uncharacterized protein n=1 Tax=Pseudoloma neurophilia TaxID=146866 RepID=A0A0R0M8T5_9MICR|nr:hypothetical protein M153_15900013759 [Pseudoloma neurophilia]
MFFLTFLIFLKSMNIRGNEEFSVDFNVLVLSDEPIPNNNLGLFFGQPQLSFGGHTTSRQLVIEGVSLQITQNFRLSAKRYLFYKEARENSSRKIDRRRESLHEERGLNLTQIRSHGELFDNELFALGNQYRNYHQQYESYKNILSQLIKSIAERILVGKEIKSVEILDVQKILNDNNNSTEDNGNE